jgi:hypothetical protein
MWPEHGHAFRRPVRDATGARLTSLAGGLAARLLGLVLLVAAYAKALDPALFASQIADLVPLPAALAHPAAIAAIAFEGGLGAALLAGWRHPLLLGVTNLTFVAFLGIVLWQWWHPSEAGASCGCFGALVERTPEQAVIEDVVFVTLSAVAWLGRPSPARARWVAAVLGAVVGGALAIASPSLPLDDQATALAPGRTVEQTKLDEVIADLKTGRHLVLLLDRGDAATQARIPELNQRLGLPTGGTRVWGVAADDPALASAFMFSAGPAFEIRSAPAAMLRTLYRTLPRSALVDDGRIVETWTGFPPDPALDRMARGELPGEPK